ncbi:MAG TPA: tetratricopeptide repeat protein [Bacteroidia bacterium]|nr:tetratricopeptide repeat protein [Bacteroidia bacterium]
MIRFLFFLILSFRLTLCSAGTVDSLLTELKNHPAPDTIRLQILNNLGYACTDEDPEQGLLISKEAIGLALKLNDKKLLSRAYSSLGLNYHSMEQDSEAILAFREGLKICGESGDRNFMVNIYNNLGNTYHNLARYNESIAAFESAVSILNSLPKADAMRLYALRNNESTVYLTLADYNKALRCLFDAATAAEKLKDSVTLIDIYTNISIIYCYIPDYPTSLKYAHKSVDYSQHLKNKKKLASSYMAMANTLDEMERPDEAVRYYHESRQISESIGDKRGLRKTLINLGVMYSRMSNFDSSYYYFQKCEALLRGSGAQNDLSIVLNNLASILDEAPVGFLIRNQINPETRYTKAAALALQGLKIAEDLGDSDNQLDSWQTLTKIYQHAGDYENAYTALTKSNRLHDSILSTQHLLQTGALQSKYEYESKESLLKAEHEKEQAIATAELQSQVKINGLMTAGGALLLVAGAGGFILYKRRRDAEEKQTNAELKADVAETEMKALRAQMNPHFIFNSLNSISNYITQNNIQTADYFTIKFAKLMRMILEYSEKKEITIAEDLQALELYMKLEAMRMQDKFSYTLHIGPEIDPENTYVPPLILQPFIENSIWHGISPKNSKGKISLSIRKEAEMLLCTIEDDGVGRPAAANSFSLNTPGKKKSMGMGITNERISLLNKLTDARASVQLTDLEQGFRADIRLPYIHND